MLNLNRLSRVIKKKKFNYRSFTLSFLSSSPFIPCYNPLHRRLEKDQLNILRHSIINESYTSFDIQYNLCTILILVGVIVLRLWPTPTGCCSATRHPGLFDQHGHGSAGGRQCNTQVRCPRLPHSSDNLAPRRKRSNNASGWRRR